MPKGTNVRINPTSTSEVPYHASMRTPSVNEGSLLRPIFLESSSSDFEIFTDDESESPVALNFTKGQKVGVMLKLL